MDQLKYGEQINNELLVLFWEGPGREGAQLLQCLLVGASCERSTPAAHATASPERQIRLELEPQGNECRAV